LAKAESSGEKVEITSKRTETSEEYATPDGNFEAVEHLRPVRARVGGQWRGIDTTLRKAPDGAITPGVTTVGLRLSGGGSGPLVRMERAGRGMSLTWPKALPEPTLNGDTATYEVSQDVDLRVRVEPDGYSTYILIKSPEAARDPVLRELHLDVDAPGLELRKAVDGGAEAVDPGAGGPVFVTAPPKMWDSAAGGDSAPASTRAAQSAAETSATDGPGDAAKVAPINLQVAPDGGELVLRPDTELMDSPDVTYPLVLDPQSYAPKASSWTMASKYWASSPQWKFNGDSDAGMGFCGDTSRCAPLDTKRLFYQVPTSKFAGKTILSADFVVHETHSYSCSARQVELWRTKAINSSTTWNTQSASGFWIDKLKTLDEAIGYSGTCPAGDVEFWALRAVQQAAANGWSTTTFGLRATDEGDVYAWKRFSDDAYLRVQYNRPPGQIKMSQLSQSPGGACSSTSKRVGTLPTLRAMDVTDPDGDKVSVQFQASWDAGDGKGWTSRWTSGTSTSKASGSDFSIALPSSIPKNNKIGWHARTYDGAQWSPWSYEGSATDCATVYDTSVPAQPTITSAQYPASDPENPDDPWLDGVGRYGTFTFDSSAADVTKYWIGINADPTSAHTLTTSGGAAQSVKFMPETPGVNFITAQAFDGAGNASSIGTYYFRVRAGQPVRAAWPLDEESGASAISAEGGDWPAVFSGSGIGVTSGGVSGNALALEGTNGQAVTESPVLNTAKSFSVSVWAKLPGEDQGRPMTAVSQSGYASSGFEIYYSSALGGWSFLRHQTDTVSTTTVRATQPPCPAGDSTCVSDRLSRWTHLVGVFDNVAHELRLYVDGVKVATSTFTAPWDARGPVRLGDKAISGAPGNFFKGSLDEFGLFNYQLTDDQVLALSKQQPITSGGRPAKAIWHLDESADSPADRVVGRAQKITAEVHTGVHLGVAGAAGQAMHMDGSGSYAQTSQPLLDNYQSFTTAFWARLPKDKEPGATYVALHQAGVHNRGFEVYHSDTGWVFQRATADTDDATLTRAVQPACPTTPNCAAAGLGEWTQVVAVYDIDVAQMRLYVNGRLVATTPFTTPWLATGVLTIGASNYPSGRSNYFRGDLDDMRLYDRALSQHEISTLFIQHPLVEGRWKLDSADGGMSPDDSTEGNDLAVGGKASIDVTGMSNQVGTGGLVLDATEDDKGPGYAVTTVSPVHSDASFTVAAWVTAAAAPQQTAAVFSQAGLNNSGFIVRFVPNEVDPSTGRWQLEMDDADDSGARRVIAEHGNFQNNSAWNHVAVVYDALADQMRLYVDGDLEQIVCTEDAAAAGCVDHISWRSDVLPFDASAGLQLGRARSDGAWGEYWPGAIDDVWVFKGVLSETQIQVLANGAEVTTYPGP
jgi:hypothetical protein